MIRFIAALDAKRGLANEHGIPWQGKIPTDVKHFRDQTQGGTVMMGAGWYKEQKQPLPNRRNIVATNSTEPLRPGFEGTNDARKFLKDFKAWPSHLDGVQGGAEQRSKSYQKYDERAAEATTQQSAKNSSGVVSSAEQQAGVVREPDIWVGGGAALFASTLDLADELHLTLLDSDFNCTKFFPEHEQHFEKVSESEPITENGITFRFTVWKRKS